MSRSNQEPNQEEKDDDDLGSSLLLFVSSSFLWFSFDCGGGAMVACCVGDGWCTVRYSGPHPQELSSINDGNIFSRGMVLLGKREDRSGE